MMWTSWPQCIINVSEGTKDHCEPFFRQSPTPHKLYREEDLQLKQCEPLDEIRQCMSMGFEGTKDPRQPRSPTPEKCVVASASIVSVRNSSYSLHDNATSLYSPRESHVNFKVCLFM